MSASGMTELGVDDCWDFLADRPYGRLGYVLDGEVVIVPINHGVDERRVVFETGHGSKLVALDDQATVAYEVDDIDEDEATSVVVRGFVVPLSGSEALIGAGQVQPWITDAPVQVMAIVPTAVTGRRYLFARG